MDDSKLLGALAALTGGGGGGGGEEVDEAAGAALVDDIINSGNVNLAVALLDSLSAAPEVINTKST